LSDELQHRTQHHGWEQLGNKHRKGHQRVRGWKGNKISAAAAANSSCNVEDFKGLFKALLG